MLCAPRRRLWFQAAGAAAMRKHATDPLVRLACVCACMLASPTSSSFAEDTDADAVACVPKPSGATGRPRASVVVYNRIPKCGSTTLINVLRRHSSESRRYAVHNSAHFQPRLLQPFVHGTAHTAGWQELSSLMRNATRSRPLLYINHVYFPNMTEYGQPEPMAFFQVHARALLAGSACMHAHVR